MSSKAIDTRVIESSSIDAPVEIEACSKYEITTSQYGNNNESKTAHVVKHDQKKKDDMKSINHALKRDLPPFFFEDPFTEGSLNEDLTSTTFGSESYDRSSQRRMYHAGRFDHKKWNNMVHAVHFNSVSEEEYTEEAPCDTNEEDSSEVPTSSISDSEQTFEVKASDYRKFKKWEELKKNQVIASDRLDASFNRRGGIQHHDGCIRGPRYPFSPRSPAYHHDQFFDCGSHRCIQGSEQKVFPVYCKHTDACYDRMGVHPFMHKHTQRSIRDIDPRLYWMEWCLC